ncbi:DUF2950 family protein [Cupriavidus necator]|uniref:DUF2950 family protein n=1 Tax=Cupriavidus necator TaxID=106590 RepID=UPI00030D8EBE
MMRMTDNPFSAAAGARALRTLVAAVALSLGLPAMAQQVFPSPDAAAEALGDAIARSDGDALQRVLGKQYQRWCRRAPSTGTMSTNSLAPGRATPPS